MEKRGGFCGLELLSKTRLKSLMHFWVSLWPALPFYLMLSNTKLLVWQGEIWISFISSIVVEKTLFFEVLDHIICHFFEKCLDKFRGLQFSIPYSREQKHVLLFRKSETWLLKVSITNMPHIFSKNKTFFVFQDRKLKFSASFWFRILWILTKFQLIWTTFIFWSPCY